MWALFLTSGLTATATPLAVARIWMSDFLVSGSSGFANMDTQCKDQLLRVRGEPVDRVQAMVCTPTVNWGKKLAGVALSTFGTGGVSLDAGVYFPTTGGQLNMAIAQLNGTTLLNQAVLTGCGSVGEILTDAESCSGWTDWSQQPSYGVSGNVDSRWIRNSPSPTVGCQTLSYVYCVDMPPTYRIWARNSATTLQPVDGFDSLCQSDISTQITENVKALVCSSGFDWTAVLNGKLLINRFDSAALVKFPGITLQYPITTLDGAAPQLAFSSIATGCASNGTLASDNCADWHDPYERRTSASPSVTTNWLNDGTTATLDCAGSFGLYCISIPNITTIAPSPPTQYPTSFPPTSYPPNSSPPTSYPPNSSPPTSYPPNSSPPTSYPPSSSSPPTPPSTIAPTQAIDVPVPTTAPSTISPTSHEVIPTPRPPAPPTSTTPTTTPTSTPATTPTIPPTTPPSPPRTSQPTSVPVFIVITNFTGNVTQNVTVPGHGADVFVVLPHSLFLFGNSTASVVIAKAPLKDHLSGGSGAGGDSVVSIDVVVDGQAVDVMGLAIPVDFTIPRSAAACSAQIGAPTKCVWWDTAKYIWRTDNCSTRPVTLADGSLATKCSCNHLTDFAVLLDQAQPCFEPQPTEGYLTFSVIYALIFLYCFAVCVLLQIRKDSATGFMRGQHATIGAVTFVRFLSSLHYFGALGSDMVFLGIIVTLPYLLEFLLFTRVASTWLGLVQFTLLASGLQWEKIRPWFYSLNLLGSLFTIALFVAFLTDLNATTALVGTVGNACIYALLSFTFLYYSGRLVKTMGDGSTSSVKKSSPKTLFGCSSSSKILIAGRGSALCFAMQALCSVLALTLERSLIFVFTILFLFFNCCALISLLLVYYSAVSRALSKSPEKGNAPRKPRSSSIGSNQELSLSRLPSSTLGS